ncbi:MAG: CBS domain protein, partial [uncultured Rubrobacteraceae bacterium]
EQRETIPPGDRPGHRARRDHAPGRDRDSRRLGEGGYEGPAREQHPRRTGGRRRGAPGRFRERRAPPCLRVARLPEDHGGRLFCLRGRGQVGGILRRICRDSGERGDDDGGIQDRTRQERGRRRPQDGPRWGLERRRHRERKGGRYREPPRPLRRHRGPGTGL